jgi:predicted PurR-regulated permease PerM
MRTLEAASPRESDSVSADPTKTLSTRAIRVEVFERIGNLLWVVVIALVMAFCYFASSFCVTILLATFLSILIDPVVTYLERWHLPRGLSAALLIVIGMAGLGALGYSGYNRASAFVEAFPVYAERIHEMAEPVTHKIEKVEESANKLNPDPSKNVREVRLKEPPAWPNYLVRGFGSVSSTILIIGVVPFLLFFLLIRKEKYYYVLVDVLGPNNNPVEFARSLTEMVRRFTLGNLLVGAINAVITIGVLYALHIQGMVILGVASGLLNLIPFLGVVLATAVPVAGALVQLAPASSMAIIAAVVVLIHIVTTNFVAPHFIGSRINIGPVAATAGLLFWGWLWGVFGILLAIPLTGTVKMIADCHPGMKHLSNVLGGSEVAEPRRKRRVVLQQT